MADKKVAVGLGVAAGVGALLYLAAKAKAAPPEGATVKIQVFDAEGHLITSNSPLELIEGESYTVRVTVTNLSTKAGEPWDAELEVVVHASTEWEALIPVTTSMEAFAAGQTLSFDYPMMVPLGVMGFSGQISATINDPAGIRLARVLEPFTIITIEIIYGATVVIGV